MYTKAYGLRATTVRVIMRNEREREKRKRTSMGTRSAGAGEVRRCGQELRVRAHRPLRDALRQ